MARGTWNDIVEIINGETYFFEPKTGYHSVAIYMLENYIEKNGYKAFLTINKTDPDKILKSAAELVFLSYEIRKSKGRQGLNNRDRERLRRIIYKTLETKLKELNVI